MTRAQSGEAGNPPQHQEAALLERLRIERIEAGPAQCDGKLPVSSQAVLDRPIVGVGGWA